MPHLRQRNNNGIFMKTGLNLRTAAVQTLAMTPQLQQAIRLLQLSTTELQAEIQENLDKNPLLEVDENGSDSHVESLDAMEERATMGQVADDDFNPFNNDCTVSSDDAQFATPLTATASTAETNDMPMPQDYGLAGSMAESRDSGDGTDFDSSATNASTSSAEDNTWNDNFSAGQSASRSSFDGEGEMYQGETVYDLKEHLLWQLNVSPFTARDRYIAEVIIDAIDESGYLQETNEGLLQAVTLEYPDAEMDEIEVVLKLVQHFDPVGVAARSIKECLLIQINQFDLTDKTNQLAKQIIEDHIDLLGTRDYRKLQKLLGIKEPELKKAFAVITSLEPRPGNSIITDKNEFIIPDITVVKRNGVWVAELNPAAVPKLKINETYSSLCQSATNPQDTQYIKSHMQEANWFIQSLNKRNETLLKVANCIIEQQSDFFEKGEQAMKPLVLNNVATAVSMHESTVSRVTTEKYMHTPRGTFELKYFFSSHVNTDNGGEFSSTAIRSLIKDLIKDEDPTKPLSDNQLADMLKAKGIMVARRTVAKYRESLNIPSSSQRKSIS